MSVYQVKPHWSREMADAVCMAVSKELGISIPRGHWEQLFHDLHSSAYVRALLRNATDRAESEAHDRRLM